MVTTFSKFIILLNVCYLIKQTLSRGSIKYIKNVRIYDGAQVKFNYEDLNIQVNFNPVDEEWKRQTCRRLGFTYKGRKKLFNMAPDKSPWYLNDKRGNLYKVLSQFICGDRNYYVKLKKKICLNLRKNDRVKEFFRIKEWFEHFTKIYIKLLDPIPPINGDKYQQCPICLEDSEVILNTCNHILCYDCAEKLLISNRAKCPLCRADFKYYLDKDEGNVVCPNGIIELFAAAYYLDVCIFVYYHSKGWILLHKDWPDFSSWDKKDKKCIYLHLSVRNTGIVTDLGEL